MLSCKNIAAVVVFFLFFVLCCHVILCISESLPLLSHCVSVCMFSVCLYVSVSSIWVNTPAIRSSHRPYSASLSPSNLPSAWSRLLPFRQGPWFLLDGLKWLSCVMCSWEPSSFSLFFTPTPALLRRCCWGVTCRSSPAVEKHWFRFLFTLNPTAETFWQRGNLKEWNHSDWSLDVP